MRYAIINLKGGDSVMKKIISIVLMLAIILSFAACDDDIKEKTIGDPEKAMGVPDDFKDSRTTDISAGIDIEGDEYEYSADFDFDGRPEEIEIDFDELNKSYWALEMEISVGNYKITREVAGSQIEAVYVCDIDENDGVRDLVVITNEMSDDPVVRIFNYKSGLPAYTFITNYSTEPVDEKWLGYAVEKYFNVNDDGSITMEEQTSSVGMWSVYKTYYRNEDGHFVENVPQYYEVLPDFMENREIFREDMTAEEKAKWDEGYIMAHTDFTAEDGYKFHKGEYFKVIYDDGQNNLCIEKEDGETVWVNMGYSMEREKLNWNFFFLAG